METKQLTEREKINLGKDWAEMFMMKRDRTSKDRYQTTGGTKSALGIFNTI